MAKVEARLQLPIQTLDLKAGDYANITDHQKHRVAWTSDEETIWLAIFLRLTFAATSLSYRRTCQAQASTHAVSDEQGQQRCIRNGDGLTG